ncbi:hypothetical protein [Haliangium sp.]|uniref:hypothetical protein n=1 Tax=Haliangium sp. TaxID=2663208 RepID=UPI003D12433A
MSYRNDLEAARMRRDALARELNEVRRRMNELDTLGDRAQELERELDASARDLDRARAKTRLPLLGQVRVASPCHERWDDMSGDERVRHCQRCDKDVYDLSALTEAQAEALLREHLGGSLCVRFYRRADGTVMTSDCPVGRGRRRRRRTLAVALAGGVLATGAGLSMAAMGTCRTMGEVAPPPEIGVTATMGEVTPLPEVEVEVVLGGLVAPEDLPDQGQMIVDPALDEAQVEPEPTRPERGPVMGRIPIRRK